MRKILIIVAALVVVALPFLHQGWFGVPKMISLPYIWEAYQWVFWIFIGVAVVLILALVFADFTYQLHSWVIWATALLSLLFILGPKPDTDKEEERNELVLVTPVNADSLTKVEAAENKMATDAENSKQTNQDTVSNKNASSKTVSLFVTIRNAALRVYYNNIVAFGKRSPQSTVTPTDPLAEILAADKKRLDSVNTVVQQKEGELLVIVQKRQKDSVAIVQHRDQIDSMFRRLQNIEAQIAALKNAAPVLVNTPPPALDTAKETKSTAKGGNNRKSNKRYTKPASNRPLDLPPDKYIDAKGIVQTVKTPKNS